MMLSSQSWVERTAHSWKAHQLWHINEEVVYHSTLCSFTNGEQFLPLVLMVIGGRIQTWVFSDQLPLDLMFSRSKVKVRGKGMKELQIEA